MVLYDVYGRTPPKETGVPGLTVAEAEVAFARLRLDGFRFSDQTLLLLDGLETIAITDGAGFDLAVVVLLADLLQGGQPAPLLAEVWPRALIRSQDWADTLRAALANGLRRAGELGLLVLDRPPGDADGLTRTKEAVVVPLLRMARAMTVADLLAVAQADRGQDVERHLAALRQITLPMEGVFPAGETWFGVEVVELVSHVPGSVGHAGCTAILLLNAVATGDCMGWFDFRWIRQWPQYLALPPASREPVLAGLRYLYESDPTFLSAYYISDADEATGARFGGWNCVAIPVVDKLG